MSESPTRISLKMSVSVRCNICSALTPLPGLRRELPCRNCAAMIDVCRKKPSAVRYYFGEYCDALAEAAFLINPGEKCSFGNDSSDFQIHMRREAAACRGCGATLTQPIEGTPTMQCPKCHDVIAVRWSDEGTKHWDPRITCVIGDGKDMGTVPRELASQGSVVGCERCGAPLGEPDGGDSRRSRACEHCGASNYIPDVAWLAMYPQPKWHRWYLVYDLDARSFVDLYDWTLGKHGRYNLKRKLRARLTEEQAQYLAIVRQDIVQAMGRGDVSETDLNLLAFDPALTKEHALAVDARLDDTTRQRMGDHASGSLAELWATSELPDLRQVVAAHPSVSASVLESLVQDSNVAVRLALASNVKAPPAILKKLRKDAEESVVKAVRKNRSYQPGLFESLFFIPLRR